MKKIILATTGIFCLLVAMSHTRYRQVHGQAQVSNQPQSRIAAVAITHGQVLSSAACSLYSTTEICVTPASGTGLVAGVAAEDCAAGVRCQIMMTGVFECHFDNTPVMQQLALHNGADCDSQAGNLLNFRVDQGVVGFVYAVDPADSTRAWVVGYRPGASGYITPASLTSGFGLVATSNLYSDLTGKPTIPAAQVNSDWTAVSGVTQILNKPVIPAGPNTAWYLNGTLVSGAPSANSLRCGWGTGTTSGSGTITFSPNTILGTTLTTLVGPPQPAVNLATSAPATVNITGTPSTTSVNVFATGGSVVTILTIQLVAFNAAAIPVSVFLCGK